MMAIVAVSFFVGCKNEPEAKTYKVGDTGPAGGIIFYDKGSYSDGWRYLEAAKSDLMNDSNNKNFTWGSEGTYNTEEGVGKGKSNTDTLMSKATQDITFPAAQACYDYEYTNEETGVKYDDWFLPSKDELNLMYRQKDSIGSFESSYYWSSSENSETGYVWYQYFNDEGEQEDNYRNCTYYVRPVRRF